LSHTDFKTHFELPLFPALGFGCFHVPCYPLDNQIFGTNTCFFFAPTKSDHYSSSVFGSVIADAFQIIFYAKIHANDIFLFFKNYF
jgi:hypothetical protein